MKLARYAAPAGAIALALAAGWLFARHGPPAPPAAAAPRVPTAVVREGFVERSIRLAGRIGPAAGTQVKLAFSIPGTVLRVEVRLGERVDAGAELARIDPTSYSLAARQAGADAQAAAATAAAAGVDKTTAKLDADRAELTRRQRLYAAGIVALRDVQAAQTTVAADGAEARSAGDQLLAAQAASRSTMARAASTGYDVSRTVLRAPAAGTVTAIFAQPGQTVDPSIAVVALAPALSGSATLDVAVNDVPAIAPGDAVRGRAGGRTFGAIVSGIAPAVNPATGLATVSLRGVPAGLPPGTPLDARVVTGRARGLVIPRDAVVEDPGNGNTLVFVQNRTREGGVRFVARAVRIDARSDTLVGVGAGLRAGERVASQGAIDLLSPDTSGR